MREEEEKSKKQLFLFNRMPFKAVSDNKENSLSENSGKKIIYLEPRTIRHQDRIIDLFRVLFRRK